MATISLEPTRRTNVYYQAAEPHSSIRATEQFIASGADLDERHGPDGNTPLMQAADYGHACSVELLLQAGASIDKRNSSGDLPLQVAAMNHHGRCVEMIIAQSPDAHITEAMVAACRRSDSCALLSLMLAARSLDASDAYGDTPLTMAVDYDSHCVELLLQRGADVNAANTAGWTPLAVAALNGRVRSARVLLAHPHIEVNPVMDLRAYRQMYYFVREKSGYMPSAMTPLLIAAVIGSFESLGVLSMLVKHGEIDTRMTTSGDAHGWLVDDIAPASWLPFILEARRTQGYRSRRGKMAAFRIQRFLRDTTCNPMYAAARRALMRQYAS